jgi:2-polyprenyl-6-methoxyphenol hydroxylase-like FAD-dependent oxidoreductase
VAERSAVVVGAGIGGLAAAGALAHSGWQVTLLDRADRLRSDGAAHLLWPNGVQALRALGLGAGLEAIAVPVPPGGVRRPDGQWLHRPNAGHPDVGGGPVVVHGADLHDALVAGLGDRIDVRTGCDVRTLRTSGERPTVSDGRTTWAADLIVGADGADSLVRRRLAPSVALVSGGYAMWRAVIPAFRAPELPPGTEAGDTIGAGHRFRYAVLGKPGSTGSPAQGAIFWLATVPGAARPEPTATQRMLLQRWFTGWHSPIGELLAATAPDELVQEPVRQLRPLPSSLAFPAGRGGCVLVGDAGHAMTGHLGQGPGLALEDAAALRAVLQGAVPGRSLSDSMQAYSRLRSPRTARLAGYARRVDLVVQARGRFSLGARSAARTLERAQASAADWHPPDG